MTWQSEWKNLKNILCVRLDNLGDIILSTPVFHTLKESFPNTHLTLLTSSVGEKITPFIPDIDEVISFDAPWIDNELLDISHKKTFALLSRLQKKRFDGAVILTNFSQTSLPFAFFLYLARIPRILGYSREDPHDLINYWVPDTEPFDFPIHGVLRQLKLISKIGAKSTRKELKLSIDSSSIKKIEKKLAQKKINAKNPFIIIHSGASLQRRQYPRSHYIKAARMIISELGYQVVFSGSKNERASSQMMATAVGNHACSFAGETTIGEFIALIGLAKVLISNNTSAVHIAAACNTPVVDLYARSNPEHTPWKVKHRVLYFDVPKKLLTKNTLLLYVIPSNKNLFPQPYHIVQAVKELINKRVKTSLPSELINWAYLPNNISTNRITSL